MYSTTTLRLPEIVASSSDGDDMDGMKDAKSSSSSSFSADVPSCSVAPLAKYSTLPSVVGIMVLSPGFHPTGQTSPCSATNCSAWMRRSCSSTDLPTGKFSTLVLSMTPSGLMMNVPRKAIPISFDSVPYCAAMSFVTSATSGMFISPSPPRLRLVRIHARCVSSVSVEHPIISALCSLNLSAASENAMISVGQTNVKSFG
mmetsp:Transcript_6361/g.14488  ORF Transcript_6361/g.14488 Transcript_6361/m.14488 type:complete len:201 (-) Transcript_6361:456-1058(-)